MYLNAQEGEKINTRHTHIMLIEPKPLLLAGLKNLCESDTTMDVVFQSSTLDDAIDKIAEVKPDVIVMDVTHLGSSAPQGIRTIKQVSADTRILVLSQDQSKSTVDRFLSLGATGFASRACPTDVILNSIRSTASNYQSISFSQMESGSYSSGDSQDAENPFETLTPRELEVATMLAEGLTINEIAEKLSISPNTAGVHQTRILNKLSLKNSAKLARLAIHHHLIEA